MRKGRREAAFFIARFVEAVEALGAKSSVFESEA